MSDFTAEYRDIETRIVKSIDSGEPPDWALWLAGFEFQIRWNQPYGRFCAAHPVPSCWSEIPAVPQISFKRAALSIVPPEHAAKTFLTSGTTGEGRGAHHFLDTRLYEHAARSGWARLALPRLPHLVLMPPAHAAPQSSLSHMMTALAPFADGTSYFVDAAGQMDHERLISTLADCTAPVAVLGTALAFVHLFEQMGSRAVTLPAGSFALETGGYKGAAREIPKRELYERFERHFGIHPRDVLNEYGMTELSSQAYARGLDRPHHAPPWLRVLVIDPETGEEAALGETGVLRLFDLANLGSVLAIETQDLAVRREDGFELIGRDPAALPRGCSRQADESFRR